MSNIPDPLWPRSTEGQERPRAACYPVVFLDAIPYPVREGGRGVTEAAFMVGGLDLAGYQAVGGMWMGAHESAQFWRTVRSELKSRGVQNILGVAVDPLTVCSAAIATGWPRADIPQGIVHPIRNSLQ